MDSIFKTASSWLLTVALVLICGGSTLKSDTLSLSLVPGSSITGNAGSTVGWGYDITNDSANWVETVNLTADVFTNGAPKSIFDFPVIAPFSSVLVAFSTGSSASCTAPDCGLFEFTWNTNAAPGSTNAGTFTITSEFFGTDPLTDPNAVDLGPAPDMTASYSVATTGVPEPQTYALLLLSFATLRALKGFRAIYRR
jgi:hypothetical protein